jgi:hypothetical protein
VPKDKLDVLEAFCEDFILLIARDLAREENVLIRAGFTGSFFTANEILEKIRLIKGMTDEEVSEIGERYRKSLPEANAEGIPKGADPKVEDD